MEKKLNELSTSYEDMRKEQKRKRDLAQSGEEPEEDTTKVKKAFKKKLQIKE